MNADKLALLGLTDYEMRVYRALLAEHPATAYRLGKRSGVPLSRVYEVANRLVEKGAATLEAGEPARYIPVPPAALVQGARRRAEGQLDALGSELAALYDGEAAEGSGISVVRGESAVLARAHAFAAGAETHLQAAVSPRARGRLDTLLAHVPTGVHIRTVTLPPAAGRDDALVIVADDARALVGRLGPNADALVAAHPVLVRLCADYFQLRGVADAAQQMVAAERTSRSGDRVGRADSTDRRATWIDWEEEKQRRLLHTQ